MRKTLPPPSGPKSQGYIRTVGSERNESPKRRYRHDTNAKEALCIGCRQFSSQVFTRERVLPRQRDRKAVVQIALDSLAGARRSVSGDFSSRPQPMDCIKQMQAEADWDRGAH